jgi:hypothetical protein
MQTSIQKSNMNHLLETYILLSGFIKVHAKYLFSITGYLITCTCTASWTYSRGSAGYKTFKYNDFQLIQCWNPGTSHGLWLSNTTFSCSNCAVLSGLKIISSCESLEVTHVTTVEQNLELKESIFSLAESEYIWMAHAVNANCAEKYW